MRRSLFALTMLAMRLSATAAETTFELARELLSEQDYTLSAIEFRRYAMEENRPDRQASAYLYAGYAYLQDRRPDAAVEMLDRAENADTESDFSSTLTLLFGESARMARDTDAALYYYDALAAESAESAYKTLVIRRSAAIHLQNRDIEQARLMLQRSSEDESLALDAVNAYAAGRDKSPLAGGLWGLIPGAGYWYSGEVANGFRSLILNSLFIYGMVDTAQNDNWGAFAVITFFEVTWYSGSIYGGIDAAQRHNRNRLDTAVKAIESDMAYRPDPSMTVPLFKLNIEF